jgi:uncharacterized protein (TIGR00369 family)
VFIGAELADGDGDPIGSATIGFQRLIRRDGNPDEAGAPEGRLTRLGAEEPLDGRVLLADFMGIRSADGAVEVDLAPHIGNSFGTLQGGVVAALLEQAALRAADGKATRVADLEVHYLAAGKTGPFRATAEIVRDSGSQIVLRLELRDTADGRLLSTGVATVF